MKRTFTRHFSLFLLLMLLGMQHAFATAPYPLQRWIHAAMPQRAPVEADAMRRDAPLTVTDIYWDEGKLQTGDVLHIWVTFSGNVAVNTGMGPVTLNIYMNDGTSRTATYTQIDPTDPTSIILTYTVQEGDLQNQGLGIPIDPSVSAAAGQITASADATPVDLSTIGANNFSTNTYIQGITPTVALTPNPLPAKVSGPFTVTATFSESMVGFSMAGFTASNATLSNLQNPDGQHIQFTVLVTPNGDGPLSIQVLANSAKSVRGNDNSASNVLTSVVDQTAPTITSVGVPAGGYYNATNTLTFTVHYSENVYVTGTPALDVNIGGTVVQAQYVSGSGTTALVFTYQVLAGQQDMDGIQLGTSVGLPGGATIKDDSGNNAGNTLTGVGSTTGVFVNTTHPTVVLSTTAPAVVNTAFTVTATFSEAVSGVDFTDFTITNGTISSVTTTDNITYTIQVTPALADKAITITMPANGAVNIGNNGNLVSNTLSVWYDPTAPTITKIEGPANGAYIAGQALDFKVVFSEKVMVTGAPYIDIVIGSTTVKAQYVSGTGDSVLYYRYTVVDGDNDNDGVTVTDAQAGTGTIKDIATNNADLTLNPAVVADLTHVLVNTKKPTVIITGPAASATSVNVTITFSEAMGAVAASNFVLGGTVSGTALTNLTTADNITYTGTISFPANVTGTVTLSLPAAVVKSAVGNDNQASNLYTVNVDNRGPVVTSVTPPADKTYGLGETFTFTVNFNEPVTVSGTPQLPVVIGAANVNASYVSGSGTTALTFSYTVLAGEYDGDGVTLGTALGLNGGTLQDALGNNATLALNNIGSSAGVLVNARKPAVTLSAAPGLVNGAFTVTATFSEPVTGFTSAGITVTNGTASAPSSVDGGISYTFTVTPAADGTLTVNIPANVAVNTGNVGNTASNTISTTVDITAPFITSVDVPTAQVYNSSMVLTFKVHFSENAIVTNVPGLPIDIGGQIREAIYTGGTGTGTWTFAYLVQDGDQDMDGITLGTALDVSTSSVKDAAGNTADVTLHNVGNTTGVKVNTVHPTVTLSGAPATATGAFTITAVFSEAVTGLVASDFAASIGAAFSNLTTADNITYTVTVTPAADGTLNISLPANMAQNVGSNGNQASNTLTTTTDVSVPTVTSVDVPANKTYITGQVLNFTVHFSKVVTVTGSPALPITIGTQTVLASYTGGTGTNALTFAYTVLDGQMDLDGITVANSLLMSGATIRDASGNNAIVTLNNVGATVNVLVNTHLPTVTITGPATATGTFTATVTFSEAMTGLTLSGFTVTNGTLANLVTTDGITFTVDVTPAADGAVTLQLPANAAQNSVTAGNKASNVLSVNVTLNAAAAVITQVDVPASGTYNESSVLTFTVHYNKNVNITGTPKLPMIIGSQPVSATYVSGSGTGLLVFTYTVQNGDQDLDGIALGTALTLSGGTITDASSTNASLTLNNAAPTSNVLVNTAHPSVVISSPAPTVTAPFSIYITFSEAVMGFTASDFVLTNATISNLQTADNITYTALVIPGAAGQLTITIPANVAVSAANNGNTASNTVSTMVNFNAPYITQVNVPLDNTYRSGDVLQFSVTFNKGVYVGGAPTLDIVIGTKTAQAALISGSGTGVLTFKYTVVDGDYDMDGITLTNALNLHGGTITDANSNNADVTLQNIGNTSNIFVNALRPSVVLTGSGTGAAPFTITATFSEAVTGLTASDFVVTNATASNLQTTDNKTYTLLITPNGSNNTITINLPANTTLNAGGNGNTASNTLSVSVGSPAPVINNPPAFQVVEHSPVGTYVGTLTATASTGTLQQWTITGDNSGGAFQIDPNTGVITVKNVTLLDAKVYSTVTLTVTVSDGFNTSAPVTVHISVTPAPAAVNQAPVLDPVSDKQTCAVPANQSIQLTGGSPVEAGQALTYKVSVDKDDFTALAISNTGKITYTLKPNMSGKVNFTVVLKDDGGTANGGVDSLRVTFALTINALPAVSITADKGSEINQGESITLTADAPGAAQYAWNTGASGREINAQPTQDTTYVVTASTPQGCDASAEYSVRVKPAPDTRITATNFLSPNGDGRNDRWIVNNLQGYNNYNITIFDRAGRTVYYTRSYNNDWQGTANGEPLAEGTYYYVIQIDGLQPVTGFVTIVRDIKK